MFDVTPFSLFHPAVHIVSLITHSRSAVFFSTCLHIFLLVPPCIALVVITYIYISTLQLKTFNPLPLSGPGHSTVLFHCFIDSPWFPSLSPVSCQFIQVIHILFVGYTSSLQIVVFFLRVDTYPLKHFQSVHRYIILPFLSLSFTHHITDE